MVLNSPIKITFADSVDASTITSDHIKLENLNDGRDIPLLFEYNQSTFELTITPSDNKYNNMLLGLVDYRLSVANISSLQAELMQGLHTLEFTTISDSIENVQEPVPVENDFVAVNFFPKQGSYGISPDDIKVKFNKDVLESSVVNVDGSSKGSFIITSDTIEDLEDIGFISIKLVTGEYEVSGRIISFKPYTEYTESVGTGATLTSGVLRSSFQLTKYPVYQAVISVAGIQVVEGTDYTIDLTTGAITFKDGFQPAVGAAITAVTRQSIKLSDNTKYTVVLSGIQHEYTDSEGIVHTENLEQPVMYSFYTAFSPLYASLADIQTTYASVAIIMKTMNPIDVLEIIRENGEMAYWIAEQNENKENIDWDTPDKIVIEYVKAKTRYDILFDKYIQLAGEATTKTLGDLSIEYSMSLADLLKLIEKLKLEYLYWENMLKGSKGGKARMQVFTKGESVDDVPDYKDRGMKDWEGTKSW